MKFSSTYVPELLLHAFDVRQTTEDFDGDRNVIENTFPHVGTTSGRKATQLGSLDFAIIENNHVTGTRALAMARNEAKSLRIQLSNSQVMKVGDKELTRASSLTAMVRCSGSLCMWCGSDSPL